MQELEETEEGIGDSKMRLGSESGLEGPEDGLRVLREKGGVWNCGLG